MKIIILANSSVGLYRFRGELIKTLKQYASIALVVPYGQQMDALIKYGCKCYNVSVDRRGINPFKDFGLLQQYRHIIHQEKPDLVITYTIKPNIYGGLVCRWAKVPYAANITGLGTAFQNPGMLRTLVTHLYHTALKKAKVVFFENAENQQIFVDEKIIDKHRTCLLNGAGVNLEHFQVAEYPACDGPTRFLFVGRVMQEKGIDELFTAMTRLNRDGISCTLDVLGGYEENYAAKMKQYEKAGWLHYHGYQKDVRPFIATSHCFVLPSWHEGMANTNLECAASGRPVITSNIYGCKEAVIDGVSGLLCQRKDADSLYEVMKHFTRLSHEQRKQMGLAGRKHMEDVFDKQKVVAETIRCLWGEEKL